MRLKSKIIASILLISSISQASEIAIDSIGVNLGISNIKAKQTNKAGSLTLTNSPDESYTNSELYILVDGFTEDKSIKASLNYINSTNSEFKNNLLMIGINKYYKLNNYNLYAGVLVGMGHLEWKYNPLLNPTKENFTTASGVGAIQAGAEYKLTKNLNLGLNTKYYRSNYATSIELGDNYSEIKHSSSYSLAFGVRYFF